MPMLTASASGLICAARMPSVAAGASRPEGVYDNFTLPAGKSHLNGVDARRFATYRYVTSDLGRQQRQQQLIWALRNRALQGNTIGRIPELWDAFSDFFETDLGLADVLRLANLAARVRSSDVYGIGFSRAALRDHTTPAGEMVLLLGDRAALQDDLARLFLKRSAGQTDPAAMGSAGESPPPPR